MQLMFGILVMNERDATGIETGLVATRMNHVTGKL